MKSRLRYELHEFLIQERISFESGIVNYITYQLAGISVTEKQLSHGFSLAKDGYSLEAEKEKVKFLIPAEFNLEQIEKLMQFLKLPKEHYRHNKPLVLDNHYIFEEFVPKFKEFFQMLKVSSPEIVIQYRVKSASIIESTARRTLQQYIDESKDILMADSLNDLTPTMKEMVKYILLLSAQMNTLNKFPLFYKDILEGNEIIINFLKMPEIIANEKLSSKLSMILKGIELYAHYHRNESVLANMAFIKEFKAFLIPHRIATSKCDLLEHVVLNLADAKMRTASDCQYRTGYDTSRLVITFGDIDQENVDKVIAYMRALGDGTASIGYGSQRYGSSLEDRGLQCAFVGTREEEDVVHPDMLDEPTPHTIEVDGKFFYDQVFPRVKEKIEQMATENQLTGYQELSKAHFKPKETAVVSAMSLFGQAGAGRAQTMIDHVAGFMH